MSEIEEASAGEQIVVSLRRESGEASHVRRI